jgi:hypothetical protein
MKWDAGNAGKGVCVYPEHLGCVDTDMCPGLPNFPHNTHTGRTRAGKIGLSLISSTATDETEIDIHREMAERKKHDFSEGPSAAYRSTR